MWVGRSDNRHEGHRISEPMKWILGLSIIAVSLGALLSSLYSPQLHAILAAGNVVPTSEPFTELYFEDADQLHATAAAGKIVPFKFTIHNQEGRDVNYRYQVYIVAEGRATTLFTENTILVGEGQSATIPLTPRMSARRSAETIVVVLPEQQQHIDFHVQVH